MKRLCGSVLLALAVSAVSMSVAAQPAAFTVRDVDVFAGPSSEYPPIGTLAPNTEVRIAGCLSDWSWCDVIFPQDRGWVYAADLAYPYHNERVVILDNGPRLGLPVVTFSLETYWAAHYRTHQFYAQRQQWQSRVHVQADRGGALPKGHAEARARAPERAAAPQTRQPSAQAEQPQASQRQSQASERPGAEPNARAGEKAARPSEESTRSEEQNARTQQREARPSEEKAQSENARSQQKSARQPEEARPQQNARSSEENARAQQQAARQSEEKAPASRQSEEPRQAEKGRAEERRQPEEANRQPDSERQ
jgi:uncharacterized protein YraI